MSAPDQPKAPATQRVSAVWLKRYAAKDHDGVAADLALDLRDARARIAELEAERENLSEINCGLRQTIDRSAGIAVHWQREKDNIIAAKNAALARADRLATELAEAKAAGRKEGLREAITIITDQFSAFPTRSLAKEALDCAIDAVRARLSAAEPTADTGTEIDPRFPLPWSVDRLGQPDTIFDANGVPIMECADSELARRVMERCNGGTLEDKADG